MIGFPEQTLQEMQKQEQTPQDSRLAVIGGTNDNIGQRPVQVVVKGGGENPEEAGENSGSDWVISIEGKLKQAGEEQAASLRSELCIYKVPHRLRQFNDVAFVPETVSLGPYHHDNKRLRQMDRHKWRFLHRVLERTNHDIKVYLDSVREVEKRARSYYEGPIPLSSDEFVEMMVLDGCFVLELFRGTDLDEGFENLGYPRNDPIFTNLGSLSSIQRDMILLENQLPLFILDRLLKLQLGCHFQIDVAKLAVKFFDDVTTTDPTFVGKKAFDPPSDAGLHCLEIFWRSLLRGSKPDHLLYIKRSSPNSDDADKKDQMIHCATELKDSGIKFKERKVDRLWDIKFQNGVLWIPRISIGYGAKPLFLNLVAFEQCNFGCSNYISWYVSFMEDLINSPMDVANLRSCGIIEHGFGSDSAVADLFNGLCDGMILDINENYLSKVADDLNEYHSRRWNVWKATLKHKYFNSPWTIISVIAAVVLLLLTFTQTLYAVYAYYRPSS